MNRLRELRDEVGFPLVKVAADIGISKTYMADLEKGKNRLNEEVLHKLSDYYGVSTDYILGRSSKKEGYILDVIPQELRDLGVDYLTVTKELKERGLTPEDVRALIKTVTKINLSRRE